MRRTVTAIFVAAVQYRSWIDRHAVVGIVSRQTRGTRAHSGALKLQHW